MDRSEIADTFCKAISSGNVPALFEDFVSEQTTWAVVFGTDPSDSERHFLGVPRAETREELLVVANIRIELTDALAEFDSCGRERSKKIQLYDQSA